jgi:hypothetical protein
MLVPPLLAYIRFFTPREVRQPICIGPAPFLGLYLEKAPVGVWRDVDPVKQDIADSGDGAPRLKAAWASSFGPDVAAQREIAPLGQVAADSGRQHLGWAAHDLAADGLYPTDHLGQLSNALQL